MSPYVHQDGCAGSYITEDWVSERCLHLPTHLCVHRTARKSRATGPRRTQCQHVHHTQMPKDTKYQLLSLCESKENHTTRIKITSEQDQPWTVDKVAGGTTVTFWGWSLGSTGWEERTDSWIVLTVKTKEKPYDSINKQSLTETWGGKGLGGEPTS